MPQPGGRNKQRNEEPESGNAIKLRLEAFDEPFIGNFRLKRVDSLLLSQ